jgi:hypothetical protein
MNQYRRFWPQVHHQASYFHQFDHSNVMCGVTTNERSNATRNHFIMIFSSEAEYSSLVGVQPTPLTIFASVHHRHRLVSSKGWQRQRLAKERREDTFVPRQLLHLESHHGGGVI